MNVLFLTSAAPSRAGFSTSEKRPPIGVGILLSILKNEGHTVFFSDEYLKETDILDSDFLIRENIDYVCIYSNTICYRSTLNYFEKLKSLRNSGEWNGKIIVGGPHTSIGLSTIPDYVDHVVIGEGEISLPLILSGNEVDRVVKGKVVENLDDLPRPAWEEFIYRPYDWGHSWLVESYPIYTLNTSRGCPFSCTFCSVNSIWGKSYRYMSAERVFDDVLYMMRYYGARGIYFREDHFTLNKERVIQFCNLLLAKNIKIEWMCESRADDLCDREYQRLMHAAGCKVFYIGVESGSPRILKRLKKGENVEDFICAFDIAREVGIKTYASLVVGLPFEDNEDLDLTDKLIARVKPDYLCKNIYVGIPGSELYDYCLENKLYEHIDEVGIIYPDGYKENIRKYYRDEYFSVYDLNSIDRIKTKLSFSINKIFSKLRK